MPAAPLPLTPGRPAPLSHARVVERSRSAHDSRATEKAYVGRIGRSVRFHSGRCPRESGEPAVDRFLSHLAADRNVAAPTRNRTLAAVPFLYDQFLGEPLGETVREGEGEKDRHTMPPAAAGPGLRRRIEPARSLHEEDAARGFDTVELPAAFARKSPAAARDFRWRSVFPAAQISRDPRGGVRRRAAAASPARILGLPCQFGRGPAERFLEAGDGPHFPAWLRHAPDRGRRSSPHRAGTARAQRRPDDGAPSTRNRRPRPEPRRPQRHQPGRLRPSRTRRDARSRASVIVQSAGETLVEGQR